MIFHYFRFRIFLDEKIEQSYYLKKFVFSLFSVWNETNLFQYPVAFGKTKDYNPECYKVLEGAFDVLNKFLDGQDYAAGRNLTIADLALAATVSTAEVLGSYV